MAKLPYGNWDPKDNPAIRAGFNTKAAFLTYLDKFRTGEAQMICDSTYDSTLRGEPVTEIKFGTDVIICFPGTPLDGRAAQVLRKQRHGLYTVQLVDFENIPAETITHLETVGLRADDLFIVKGGFAQEISRASDHGEAANTGEAWQPYKAHSIYDTGAWAEAQDVGGYASNKSIFVRGTLCSAPPITVGGPTGEPVVLRLWGTVVIRSNTGQDPIVMKQVYYAPG